MDIALPPGAAEEHRRNRMADWIMGRVKYWGNPSFDINSNSFWEVVADIIRVWGDWYKQEYEDMVHNRKIDLAGEKSLKDLVSVGFKKSINYPPHFFALMKWVWPNGKMSDKEFTRKFAKKFPVFRNSNYT